MTRYPFQQVDVFAPAPLCGNPVAVVLQAQGLTDAQMAALARWTHLSETTFVLPPTDAAADYRLRIFTPGGELPFAGHPTLGSCHAWLAAGGVPRQAGRIVQQCGVGRVQLRQADGVLAFQAPPMIATPVDAALLATVCSALGLAPAQVRAAALLDNGPRWLSLWLDSAAAVLALRPDHARLKALEKVGVIGSYPAGPATADEDGTAPRFEVRAFAASIGVDEDPVTGSLNASLAQWLRRRGEAPAARYTVSQGLALGRRGQVWIEHDGDALWVGGRTLTCLDGHLHL